MKCSEILQKCRYCNIQIPRVSPEQENMRIERPTETLQRFAKDINWITQPIEVVAKDLKSSATESRHEWDAFYYEERDGRLFDPVRQKTIVGTDGGDKAQKKVNQELEDWFLTHESGIAVRISPSGGEWNYPDEQVEIYRIAYSLPSLQKTLFCSFRQFRANLNNPEEIRQTIFSEEDSERAVFEIIKWVEKKSQQQVETIINNETLRSNQSYYYATMLKKGMNPGLVFDSMVQSGFLGEHAIGCAGSNTSSSLSLTDSPMQRHEFSGTSGWHEGICRICGISTLVGPCSICRPCEKKL